MERFLGRIVVGLCVGLFLVATASGSSMKSVYLKDGGVIECMSFWKKDGMLMVKVNRDVVVDLANEEVDMTRTFAKKPAKLWKKKAKAVKKVHSVVSGAPTVVIQPAAKKGAVPATALQPPAKTDAAAAVAVPPAAKPAAASAVAAQPPAKSGAASAAASPASPPQGKPLAVVKPSQQSAEAPTRKTLPLIAAKTVVPANASFCLLGGGMLLPILIVYLILIVSFWKVFSKAGEAGWQGIIPIYNMFVLVRIAGKPWWWFLLLMVPVVSLVIWVLLSIDLAKRFDQGVPFGLGLAFIGFVFYPILAFGKAAYR